MLFESGLVDTSISVEEQIKRCVEIINIKIDKLNSLKEYSICRNQELFVFLHTYLSFADIRKIYNMIGERYKIVGKKFSCVFILSDCYLYECREDYFFPHAILETNNICRYKAYKESGMEEKSELLLKQQGHI